MSGGKALDVKWTPYNTSSANVWVADVQGQVDDVPGLQLDGACQRTLPNLPAGIEASCGYGCMVPSKQADWTPPTLTSMAT